ncbi:MAG: hypothetical protein ACHQM4_09840 [Thermoanaerobaculia bacterium]
MRNRIVLLLPILLAAAAPARGAIQRNPTGVNVSSQSATTVFITFAGLVNQTPVAATWCGEVIPATPDIGFRCDPNTVYGQLPLRYDQSRLNGGLFTDIMTIPANVARRAYQAAERGALSPFFYVRRFVSSSGGPDEYVFVTCRPSAGGAGTPLSLTDVALSFDIARPVLSVQRGEVPPKLKADIRYTGTGRLKGRWEVVFPQDEPPSDRDLLTEATLPPAERGLQRRYTELERFDVFLPPTGRVTLPGPDPKRIPTASEGPHQILLRVEASDDKEGDSSLVALDAGAAVIHSGGVAGFPLPTLRYFVGVAPAELLPGATGGLVLLAPAHRSLLPAGEPLVFRFTRVGSAAGYRLAIRGPDGAVLVEAYLASGTDSYAAPPFLAERAKDSILSWTVEALGADGGTLATSGAAELRFSARPKGTP